MPTVSLQTIVEALDLQSDELRSYVDLKTGAIITFNQEQASFAQRGEWDKAPAWMRDTLPQIKRALEGDQMLGLPDRVHIDEWHMMQNFALGEEQCECRAELESAVHGASASRRFGEAIQRLGLEDSWLHYRQAEYERLAREWLEANRISYR